MSGSNDTSLGSIMAEFIIYFTIDYYLDPDALNIIRVREQSNKRLNTKVCHQNFYCFNSLKDKRVPGPIQTLLSAIECR